MRTISNLSQGVYDSIQRELVQKYTKNLLLCILFVRIVTRLNQFYILYFQQTIKTDAMQLVFVGNPITKSWLLVLVECWSVLIVKLKMSLFYIIKVTRQKLFSLFELLKLYTKHTRIIPNGFRSIEIFFQWFNGLFQK